MALRLGLLNPEPTERCASRPEVRSAPPKVFEPVGRHVGVPDRVLDVPVPEVVLQSPCVVAIVGELEPTGMAQHVWVDREWRLGSLADAREMPITGIAACCARAASGHATAAPPNSVMNSRLLTRSPRRRERSASVEFRDPAQKLKCCSNMPSRRILRDVNEDVRDIVASEPHALEAAMNLQMGKSHLHALALVTRPLEGLRTH